MHVAADAAVYEAARRRRQQQQQQAEPVAAVQQDIVTSAVTHVVSQSMSVASKPAASSLYASVAAAGAARKQHDRNLALLQRYAAEETTAPLLAMHCVLGDVAARILVDAARRAAEHLSGPLGCWLNHAALGPCGSTLEMGFSLRFWSQAVLLLPQQLPALGSSKGTGEQRTTAGQPASRYAGEHVQP
jgi:hypothetical protein